MFNTDIERIEYCENEKYQIIEYNEHDNLKKKEKKIHSESREEYIQKVYPYIHTYDRKWLDNIFAHKKEQDRVLLETNEYILLPDMHWKKFTQINKLHYLIFYKNEELKSIRDIQFKHMSLLYNSYLTAIQLIKMIHVLDESENLICEFHYHPSIWQLHCHIYIKTNKRYTTKYAYTINEIFNKTIQDPTYWNTAMLNYYI